jgi:hypothetical protein
MSAPVWATNTSALIRERPGMLANRPRAREKRCHCFLDSGIQARDVGAVGVDAIQKQSRHERVVGVESPPQRLDQRADLRPHPPLRQVGEHRRLAPPAD